jgi:hypothetical protein
MLPADVGVELVLAGRAPARHRAPELGEVAGVHVVDAAEVGRHARLEPAERTA